MLHPSSESLVVYSLPGRASARMRLPGRLQPRNIRPLSVHAQQKKGYKNLKFM
ncbi:hypothetical protein BN871_FI_00130 [Paenibacillus sp. P22]|nr:hypothetical protein BN871_FI_00130 [Paenibacillus sp. P22]